MEFDVQDVEMYDKNGMKGEDLRHDRCICRPGFGGIRKTFGLLRRPREFLVCPTPQAVANLVLYMRNGTKGLGERLPGCE